MTFEGSKHLIRSILPSEEESAVRVLVKAFHNDPIARFAFSDEVVRDENHFQMFGDLIKGHQDNTTIVDVTDNLDAVAIWKRKINVVDEEPAGGDKGNPPGLSTHAEELFKRVDSNEPPRPHIYLAFIGASTQGTGAGSALIRYRLEQIQKDEKVALWTGNEKNLKFYERFGFKVISNIKVDEQEAFWMIRE